MPSMSNGGDGDNISLNISTGGGGGVGVGGVGGGGTTITSSGHDLSISSCDGEEVHILDGSSFPSSKTVEPEMNRNQQNPPPVLYDVVRGRAHEPARNCQTYDHVFYRNAFMVLDGPILLHSVVFFGPANADSAVYKVTVFVETPTFDLDYPWYFHCMPWLYKSGQIFGSFSGSVEVEKGSMIHVTFDQPIHIPPNKWIGITFLINGVHPTARMRSGKQKNEVDVAIQGGQVRRFQFLTGSCQMPMMRFFV